MLTAWEADCDHDPSRFVNKDDQWRCELCGAKGGDIEVVPRYITERIYKYADSMHFHREPEARFGCPICEALDSYREEVRDE